MEAAQLREGHQLVSIQRPFRLLCPWNVFRLVAKWISEPDQPACFERWFMGLQVGLVYLILILERVASLNGLLKLCNFFFC